MNRPSLDFHIPAKTVLCTGCYVAVGASETDAKVTGSSPSFKIRGGSAESTQKGGTGREKREKYEDSDEREDSDLAIVKTRRYHFDDEPFIHPLHSVRFDSDHPYELSIESLLALRRRDPSKGKDPSLQRSGPSRRASLEGEGPLKSWEHIPPSEGWMCDGDEVEGKEVSGGISARVDEAKGIEEENKNEEEEEEYPEEDPSEEEMPTIPRAMDVDADDDYLQYLEELCCHPEYSPIHSSQAFSQNPSDDARSPSSDARSQPSFDLSGIWLPLVGLSQ
ncbi:hypothetical protein PIB30_097390 [Stylosanthes scabra]|uniref:Uncharacterized protein n=1 Tax=Stylosanthes scabra TaxID=79078 RepID=A0ABU6SXV3_9FABA|nr:hypothetical protein [Stylosanthes scabra]